MQCPRCGVENSSNRAACWSCFAQLVVEKSGKPQEIVMAPREEPAPVEHAEPMAATPPMPTPEPVAQAVQPVVEPAAPVIEPMAAEPAPEIISEVDHEFTIGGMPFVDEEPVQASPSNLQDLSEPAVELTTPMAAEPESEIISEVDHEFSIGGMPLENDEPAQVMPSNALDLDSAEEEVDISKFFVPGLAEPEGEPTDDDKHQH